MSQDPTLPLYQRTDRTLYNGSSSMRLGKKRRESFLLIVLVIAFVMAWLTILTYMPEVQHSETTFATTYSRFFQRPIEYIHDTPRNVMSPASPSEENGNHKLDYDDMQGGNEDNQINDELSDEYHHQDKTDEQTGNQPDELGDPSKLHPELGDPSKLNPELGDPSKLNPELGDPSKLHPELGDPSNADDNPPQSFSKDTIVDEQNVEGDVVGTADVERRYKIKEMIKHAWDGYAKYAFGDNELKPISKRGYSAAVFGKTRLGATLVDSLDTLYIAGLYDEFNQGRDWVKDNFNIEQVNSDLSVFEVNIRFIGGFLSAYAFSGDEIFKERAVSIAEKLMPAFNNPFGFPKSLINFKTGASKNWGWASGGSFVLAEIGTLHLEFQYLTQITGNPNYLEKVQNIRTRLKETSKPDGLYYNFLNPRTGGRGQQMISLGALGDSFYEYLIKSWLITSKHDIEARDMFYDAIDAIESKTHVFQTPHGLRMVTGHTNGRSDGQMQHLACFSGGMYTLASHHAINDKSDHYMEIGKDITNTCHESYTRSATKLGPEAFHIDSSGTFTSRTNQKHYLLRPETVESYFYLWRLTHDPKYREWGWEFVQALEENCKVENGYSGIRDVYSSPSVKDDVQQSFFIAETLKYLYLLFSDDSDISLDNWVFNTEAHPLPVLPGIPEIQ